MYVDPDILKEPFNNGTNWYLSKNTQREEVIVAISTCLNGATYFNKTILKKERTNKDSYDISIKNQLT